MSDTEAEDHAAFTKALNEKVGPITAKDQQRLVIKMSEIYGCTEGTVTRWLEGRSSPIPAVHEHVFKAVETAKKELGIA